MQRFAHVLASESSHRVQGLRVERVLRHGCLALIGLRRRVSTNNPADGLCVKREDDDVLVRDLIGNRERKTIERGHASIWLFAPLWRGSGIEG